MKKLIAKVQVYMNELKKNGINSLLFDMVHLATLDYINGIIALYNDNFRTNEERNQMLYETLNTKEWLITNASYYTNGEFDGLYLVQKCDKRLAKLIKEQTKGKVGV